MGQTLRIAIAALMLGLVGLVVSGCGSSSKSVHSSPATATTTTTAASSRPSSSFIARADVICARANAQIIALDARGSSTAEVERVIPRTIAIERRGVDRLATLKPPAALASAWRSMLADRRELANMLGTLLDAARRNDGGSLARLAASKKRVHTNLSKTAADNGFKDCGMVGRVG
jgi:hypothetical protein